MTSSTTVLPIDLKSSYVAKLTKGCSYNASRHTYIVSSGFDYAGPFPKMAAGQQQLTASLLCPRFHALAFDPT